MKNLMFLLFVLLFACSDINTPVVPITESNVSFRSERDTLRYGEKSLTFVWLNSDCESVWLDEVRYNAPGSEADPMDVHKWLAYSGTSQERYMVATNAVQDFFYQRFCLRVGVDFFVERYFPANVPNTMEMYGCVYPLEEACSEYLDTKAIMLNFFCFDEPAPPDLSFPHGQSYTSFSLLLYFAPSCDNTYGSPHYTDLDVDTGQPCLLICEGNGGEG